MDALNRCRGDVERHEVNRVRGLDEQAITWRGAPHESRAFLNGCNYHLASENAPDGQNATSPSSEPGSRASLPPSLPLLLRNSTWVAMMSVV